MDLGLDFILRGVLNSTGICGFLSVQGQSQLGADVWEGYLVSAAHFLSCSSWGEKMLHVEHSARDVCSTGGTAVILTLLSLG